MFFFAESILGTPNSPNSKKGWFGESKKLALRGPMSRRHRGLGRLFPSDPLSFANAGQGCRGSRFRPPFPDSRSPTLVDYQGLLIFVPVLLFSVIAHEYAHGYAALKQGDDTALMLGRLTWNPIKHIDP